MTDAEEKSLLGKLFEVGRELYIRPGDRVLVIDGLVVSVRRNGEPPFRAEEAAAARPEDEYAAPKKVGTPPGPERIAMRGRLLRIVLGFKGRAASRQVYKALQSTNADRKTAYLVRKAMGDLEEAGALKIAGQSGSGRIYLALRDFDPAPVYAAERRALAQMEGLDDPLPEQDGAPAAALVDGGPETMDGQNGRTGPIVFLPKQPAAAQP